MIPFNYNDGGRQTAGFKGDKAGDCVARSIAIVAEAPLCGGLRFAG